MKDTVPHTRSVALALVYYLLNSKPEGERALLQALVNKFGDGSQCMGLVCSPRLMSCRRADDRVQGLAPLDAAAACASAGAILRGL
jgi:hypothetical protein